jgi:LAO/AO transport system kinase
MLLIARSRDATAQVTTDFVLLLLLPGACDELQGIKRGILELVDAIAINKADGSLLNLMVGTFRSASSCW